jgi:hypothetical protein
MDQVMETAEPVEGISLVGEETGREMVDELDTSPWTKQGNMRTGVDAFAAIDLNDGDFRRQQRELMRIFATKRTTAEELAQAMTDLHIARRCMPMVPGQASKNLIWNQIGAAARISNMAMARLRTGRGLQGTLICDDTGLGKTNSALAGMLAVRICVVRNGPRKNTTDSPQFINEQQIALNKTRDDQDWEALANAPPLRVSFRITQSHLVAQAATDAAEYSSVFDVRVYGGEKEKKNTLPHGIQHQGPALSRDSKLFDFANSLTRHVLFVTTYETFAARHGPSAAA